MDCPSCGFGAPEGARFCASCGAELAARSDERRIVTVVFADLVGFTGLAETRDPEQIKNLVDRAFERLAADVLEFGGRVDKIVGDGMVALFGDPVAHEDDAERGVRAALRMHDTLAAYSDAIGIGVRMRVGVNTGEVLVGALRAGGDRTAMGDVVNTCSRLQTSAAPGETLVGAQTFAATEGAIVYEAVGPVEVRGRAEAVSVWRAIGATGLPGYRRPVTKVPFLGRDAEIGMLRHVLRATVQRSRPGVALLVGEPGMGTTRLAEELGATARSDYDALVLEGRAVPYGEANVWWPVAEVVRELCGIALSDSATVAARKCAAAVAEATGVPEDDPQTRRLVDGLLYLLGHDGGLKDVDPARAREDAVRSLAVAIGSSAEGRPVVVLLSDLHWADEFVLDLLDRLPDELHHVPVLVVATARPEVEERFRPSGGRHNQLTIHLDPLDEAASTALVTLLLPDVPPDIHTTLIGHAGGNPLFLEELAALVAESGIAAADRAGPLELPATLRGLVAARLDTLPTGERATLEDAAVVGPAGPVEVLHALAAPRAGRPDLQGLIDRDLLVVSGDVWRFKSIVVRDVAYGTVTKAERARRHATVAEWLTERARATGREEEQLGRIAHHYGAAAMLVAELGTVDGIDAGIGEYALSVLERAAIRLESLGLHRAAAHLLDHAFRLLPEDAERPCQLLLARARARLGLRDLSGARADVTAVLEVTDRTDDGPLYARALTTLGDVQEKEGDHAEAAATLESAIALWRELGDRAGEAEALRMSGMTAMFSGDIERAQRSVTEAMDAFREAGDARGEAWALHNLAWIAFTGGDLDAADARLDVAINAFLEAGDARGAGWALGLLGFVRLGQGRFDEAAQLAESTIDGARDRGDRWGLGMMLTLLANVRLWQGRTNEGVERAREARRLFRAIGDSWGEGQSIPPLARGLVMSGNVAEGLAIIDDILELAGSITDPIIRGMAGALAVSIAVQIGEPERAAAEAPDGGTNAKPRRGPSLPGAILGLALLQRGRVDAAIASLEDVAETGAPEPSVYLSLALAAAGRPLAALRAAERALAAPGMTYVDEALCALARAFAHLQQGRPEECIAAVRAAVEIVDGTHDVLSQAVVRLGRGHALVAAGAADAPRLLSGARQRLAGLGLTAGGWDRVFSLAATAVEEHTPTGF